MAPRGASPETVERLLQRVAHGDRAALDQLLGEHRQAMHRVVALRMDGRMRGRIDPSDVVQEAQLEAARRIDDFISRRPMPFHVWLHKTAYEGLLRLRRQHIGANCRSAEKELSLPENSSIALAKQLFTASGSPSRQAGKREAAARIRQAIAQLPDDDREILLLRNFEELTNVEAAQVLGIEPAAASKRYGRSLLRLRKILLECGLTESQL
jgi:RNA polymerase sigma-70 factor (ECF subfamily)